MGVAFTEQDQILFRLQAELCQTLAEPTRLQLLHLLREGPLSVKELVEATGQRQAKISQHLATLRQRDVVRAERAGNEMRYSLSDTRILEACQLTRTLMLEQLARRGALVSALTSVREE